MKTIRLLFLSILSAFWTASSFADGGVPKPAGNPEHVIYHELFAVSVAGFSYLGPESGMVVSGIVVHHPASIEVTRFDFVGDYDARIRIWYRSKGGTASHSGLIDLKSPAFRIHARAYLGRALLKKPEELRALRLGKISFDIDRVTFQPNDD